LLINYLTETTAEGRVVKALKTMDYSDGCTRPWVLPLRHHLLWNTARKLDLYGRIPDGARVLDHPVEGGIQGEALMLDAELERVKLRCGRCQNCANRRKRRWEAAAAGFFRTTDLSLFGTLTFSNEFFAHRWNTRSDAEFDATLEYTAATYPGFDTEEIAIERSFEERVEEYDANNPEHFLFAKSLLRDERQLLMKRFRMALKRDPRFEGIKLVSHLSVYEMGDLRKRLHMHFLMSFDHPGREREEVFVLLREWLERNWFERGIGFIQTKLADKERGDGGASYLLRYLVKFEEIEDRKTVVKSRSRLATSSGYLSEGHRRLKAFNSPDEIPPVPVSGGDPPSSSALPPGSTDEEVLELKLSEASKALTDGDVPLVLKHTARTIAEAREAWNDLTLWPGSDDGLHRPEEDEAEGPPGEWEFSGWLLSHFWSDKYKMFDPAIFSLTQDELEEAGNDNDPASSPNRPGDDWSSSFAITIEDGGVVYDAETGEVRDET
jgi:hypothetical protein